MICTSIEQSLHLLKLLDPKTADMYYPIGSSIPEVCCAGDNIQADIPAWSLSALLEVMRKANAVTTLQVTSLSTLLRCKDMGFIWQNDLYIYDPVTAAYEMVCYLLRNNLIEKGDNDEEQEMLMKLASQQEKVKALRQEVAEMNKEREYWQQVRIQAAIAAMQTVDDHVSTVEELAKRCVRYADALIAELKKGGEK